MENIKPRTANTQQPMNRRHPAPRILVVGCRMLSVGNSPVLQLVSVFVFSIFLVSCQTAFSASTNNAFAWPPVTTQTKPWAYWWWMGSAVDKTNITRSMERYQQAGLGGVHIIPIYGAVGWESHYIDYLSPKWMEMMGWAVSEARRLGMDVDMTTGTGWCFGGINVSDDDANASVIADTFIVKAGERLTHQFDRAATQALMAFSINEKPVDLTGKISANGTVDFSPTNGTWTIYAISQTPSGQKVKRAAPGGEGWMLNLLYPKAMNDWLTNFTIAFDNYSGPKPRAQYQDSYEYKSDWAPDFFAQFEKRRGYKLQDELPALFETNNDDHTARVKSDYRETISDIMVENSLPQWVKWSHNHGFLTRNEAHGSPGNLLDLYALADIPETEMYHTDRSLLISKFASSAAHVAGHPLASAETGTWLDEHFTVTLADLKYLFDDMFLSGINHIFYHGCCYSPDEVPWPGWVFYASTEMNPRNSIWQDVPELNTYAARCQAILQSGKPDNDVLLYWPIYDFWHDPHGSVQLLRIHGPDWFDAQNIGQTAKELWNHGYSFDYVSDRQLASAKVLDGIIQTPGGEYKVIVVPECKYMPLETLKQLASLAEAGANIVFENHLPGDVPGANGLEEERAEFKMLLARLNQLDVAGSASGGGKTGAGHAFVGNLETGLAAVKTPSEPLVDNGLSFIRRSFDGGWHYFVANRGTNDFDGWVSFGRPVKSVVILDPLTGGSGVAARNSDAKIHLQLNAGDSVILRAFADGAVTGNPWTYWQADGRPTEISGEWKVKFVQGGPELPASFSTAKLTSWTELGDTNAVSFAGTARYSITFDAPASENKTYFLDLGTVCQSARVRLDGKDLGTLITPPFRVAVNDLKPRGNVLEVEVTNVSANRIRELDRRGGQWKNFHDINFVNLSYRPFNAANWPLTAAGLLGPVTLTPVQSD